MYFSSCVIGAPWVAETSLIYALRAMLVTLLVCCLQNFMRFVG